jgi:hypothetical protein
MKRQLYVRHDAVVELRSRPLKSVSLWAQRQICGPSGNQQRKSPRLQRQNRKQEAGRRELGTASQTPDTAEEVDLNHD